MRSGRWARRVGPDSCEGSVGALADRGATVKFGLSSLVRDPLRPFAVSRLLASTCARALRRGAVLRSCPPGRLKSRALQFRGVRPAFLTSIHTAPHHSVRSCTVSFENRRSPQWSLRRRSGDRRSEVKEEGPIESTRSDLRVECPGECARHTPGAPSPGMSGAGHPASAARADRPMVRSFIHSSAMDQQRNVAPDNSSRACPVVRSPVERPS